MRKQFDAREPSELDARLDECFAAYRDACPDPEPAADFMPRLWARIEGRRESQAAAAWRRWTEAFLSLAAAACLAIVLLQVVPQTAPVYYHSTYLDQLSEEAGPSTCCCRTWRRPKPRGRCRRIRLMGCRDDEAGRLAHCALFHARFYRWSGRRRAGGSLHSPGAFAPENHPTSPPSRSARRWLRISPNA